MNEPYVLQRLSQRAWWVQSFNYGTVFFVGERGVLIFDTLEGVYENVTRAITSVTDKALTAVVYPHYHADYIGDIARYVDAAKGLGVDLRIVASSKNGSVSTKTICVRCMASSGITCREATATSARVRTSTSSSRLSRT
jgi:alkyl sulfatase BDS1-like metallo-beta-lactamase superfamily hydrolase